MKIRLSEIPEDGKHFLLTRETAELNEALKDLIGCHDYTADFFIKPISSKNFQLTGSIKTSLPEECSLCCLDFKLPVSAKFNELLLPQMEEGRTDHYAKPNHQSDATSGGPNMVEYRGQEFDMAEYLHEVVALEEPFNPIPEQNDKGECGVCGQNIKEKSFSYIEDDSKTLNPESPFSALKNLKLN